MNFIFVDSSNTCGGIENLLIEVCKYLAIRKNNIIFIERTEKTIYHEKLKGLPNIDIISLNFYKEIQYIFRYEEKKLKKNATDILCPEKKYFLIAPFFDNLQLAIVLFGNNKNVKLIELWGHPENWKNTLRLWNNGKITVLPYVNNKYYYQQKLLAELDKRGACLYSAGVIPVFNKWYYKVELNPLNIPLLPIQKLNTHIEWKYKGNQAIHIVWCGRFDYWKNEAIIHIGKTIKELNRSNHIIKFKFDIIGFGEKKHEEYVKKEIEKLNINVKFLGGIESSKLPEIFVNYDLGIGMGLTVKKMAQIGLPSIVIDSVDNKHIKWLKCNWLFDTSDGDAGDGYYFHLANKEIPGRKYLYELLLDVIKRPDSLIEYSKRCRDYVEQNYDEMKQITNIIEYIKKSSFNGVNYPIYKRMFFLRVLYAFYIKLIL